MSTITLEIHCFKLSTWNIHYNCIEKMFKNIYLKNGLKNAKVKLCGCNRPQKDVLIKKSIILNVFY